MRQLETRRLILRPFRDSDAADLFDYARDPRVGPAAGWKPHESVEESREIIRTVFSEPETFAVVHRQDGRVIGSAGFTGRHRQEAGGPDNEIGYSLDPTYWGRGLDTGLRTWGSTPSGATTMTAITSPSGSSGSAALPSASCGCSSWRPLTMRPAWCCATP